MGTKQDAAWKAFDEAWDRARKADKKAGRRYDRFRYLEAASKARRRVLESK